jgi:hypothetical protein
MSIASTHYRLQNDLPFFCEHAPMMIRAKQGGELIPWRLNKAQTYMQFRAEEQLRTKGWVRLLLLKGRQQGGSTWTNGRFYHKASRNQGKSVFILSHEGDTTTKLFDMVKRFHDNVRTELQPRIGKSNTKQLVFEDLKSEYAAGTAGNEQVGRGGTAQLFHWSECAFCDNAYAIQEGAIKSIGLAPGTEIIIESTANGPLGLFYEKCQQALKGIGDYELVFIPWFWQDEYEREYDGSQITPEEEEFIASYFSIPFFGDLLPISREKALRKIMWRRAEIVDLSSANNLDTGKAKFRRSYPSNPVEAFLATAIGLFRTDAIMAARRALATDENAPVVMGVDGAGDGANCDRTVIVLRRGRHIFKVLKYDSMKPMRLAGIVAGLIDAEHVDMTFFDYAFGVGAVDRLHELKYRNVQGVWFSERPLADDIYSNKRSEIIIEFAKWVNGGNVRVPDDDEFHADLASIPLDQATSNGLKCIVSKEIIKKSLGGRSPDILDAAALTFAYPVRRTKGAGEGPEDADEARRWRGMGVKKSSPLASMARKRGPR